jgi:ribosomal protein L29
MKLAELRKQSDTELTSLLAKQRQALADTILESRTKEVKNVKAIRSHKLTLARVLTVLRERQLVQTAERGERA